MRLTSYLSGHAGGHGRAEALAGAGLQGEEVGGAGVEAHKEVVCLVAQLEHPPVLRGEVSTGVQGVQSLEGDL